MPQNPSRKALIVGAGFAGLATGCYLQRNGYQTEILEMGFETGGVSVSWKRKGYTFDSATNWIPGSSPALNFHRYMSEIVDWDKLQIIDFEVFQRIEAPDGSHLTVYADAERLRREMLRVAPEDRATIDEFCGAIKHVRNLQLPIDKPFDLYGIGDVAALLTKHFGLIPFTLKWRPLTIEQFARRFTNRSLRESFLKIFPAHGDFSVLGLITSLGWMNMQSTGYPIGGSARFVEVVEEKYRELGGTIRFGAKVEEILVGDGTAKGVRLAGGEACESDLVVSAADGHSTIFGMLKGAYTDRKTRRIYESRGLFPAMLQISLGVTRDFPDECHTMVIPLDPPLQMGNDRNVACMKVRIGNFDSTLSPEGTTSVVIVLRTTDYRHWTDLRSTDKEAYRKEKQRVLDAVVEALERRFGSVRENIAVTDVATPATYVRYTGVWQGSYQGWMPTPKVIGRSMRRTLPGLNRFYMAGQWIDPPGGLPRVMISGRHTAQLICHHDRRPFVAS